MLYSRPFWPCYLCKTEEAFASEFRVRITRATSGHSPEALSMTLGTLSVPSHDHAPYIFSPLQLHSTIFTLPPSHHHHQAESHRRTNNIVVPPPNHQTTKTRISTLLLALFPSSPSGRLNALCGAHSTTPLPPCLDSCAPHYQTASAPTLPPAFGDQHKRIGSRSLCTLAPTCLVLVQQAEYSLTCSSA